MTDEQRLEIDRQVVLIEQTVGGVACLHHRDGETILNACKRISDVLAGEPVD